MSKKNWLIGTGAVVVVLGVIGAVAGSGDDSPASTGAGSKASAASTRTPSSSPTPSDEPVTDEATDDATDEATVEPDPKPFKFHAAVYDYPRIATVLHKAGYDDWLSTVEDPDKLIKTVCSNIDGEVRGSDFNLGVRSALGETLTGSGDGDWGWSQRRAKRFTDALFQACYDTGQAVAKIPMTVSQENAVSTAEDYLDYSGFSRSGLIGQLKYEGYSEADAAFGADHAGANWMAEAVESAKDYMDYSSFSRSGLIGQLEYEGFTAAQAAHGADAVGLH